MAGPYTPRGHSESTKLNLTIVRIIFSKWSIEIITVLCGLKPVRLEELRKSVKGISPRVLSGKLRILEVKGIIERGVLNTRPPRVQYALTDKA
jgi:DNA-binding HxlR family transcriptional regulator